MRYDQKLADRIREGLIGQTEVEEKIMFQGMCFMVNGKMCICVRDDQIMCRIGPEKYEAALEINGCRPMIHGGRVMKGFVFVGPEGYKDKKDFDRWIELSLEFNKVAKPSKRKRT
jgi:TfoX/Sxy family transcriptional regulator of competence genes